MRKCLKTANFSVSDLEKWKSTMKDNFLIKQKIKNKKNLLNWVYIII